MCAEHTPILACVIPVFDALPSAGMQMRADPQKQHLRHMLDAGINKLITQYNDQRFSKTTVFSVGIN